MNNPMQMLQQFPQFVEQMRGKDPNQMLNDLMTSGRVSQSQLNEAQRLANQYGGMLQSMFK